VGIGLAVDVDGRQAVAEHQTLRAIVSRRADQPIEKGLEPDAIRDDQLGVRQAACVVRLRLVVLGADAGRDDRTDVRPAAADGPHDVGEDGRRGDDAEGVGVHR
jgi:hypothetical protein